MKLRNPRLIRVVALLAALLIRLWMATVRIQRVIRDDADHPADPDHSRYLYAFWHESLLVPVTFRTRVRVLISKHADGELIAQVCQHLGVGVVRGSTNRGGGRALVELWHCSEKAHLVFTPDGPRGPRRRVQPGMILLAARTGLPIVPIGIGFQRAWRARSWDRTAVPKPFSSCVCVAGKAIQVPADVDRDGLEQFRQIVEDAMLKATEAAEQLAGSRPARPSDSFEKNRGGNRGPTRTAANPGRVA